MLKKSTIVSFVLFYYLGFFATSLIFPHVTFARITRPPFSPRPFSSPRLRLRPSPTPTVPSRVSPTATPRPSPTSSPRSSPQSSPATTTKKEFIMGAINDFRSSHGKSTVRTDTQTCNFAKLRAEEISKSFNHDGFESRTNSQSLPYPSYSQVTENIAQTSDFKKVVTMWINSSGHAANMLKDTPFVCVESEGNFYAYEGWKP